MAKKGNGQEINEELERAELGWHLSTSAALVGVFFVLLSLCFLVTTESVDTQGAESVDQLVFSPSPWWALPLLVEGVVLLIVSGALAFYFSGRAQRVRWGETKIEGENESSL